MSRADRSREDVADVRIDEWDRRIRAYARRAAHAGDDADDVAQEVWTRIGGGACPRFLATPPKERSAYLWNVARHAAARLARVARRHEGEPIEAAAGVPCRSDGPAVVFDRLELRDRCSDLLDDLRACVPNEHWRVFSLRAVDEKTWSAVAAELDLEVDQVRYRYRVALKELRRIGRRRGFD